MVNIEDFIKRLEQILDFYNLNASSFADKIGVQRSSMSHLLSGRNKPSLDFILKIDEEFPEVDLYWILNGEGTFPKSEKNIETKNVPPPPIQSHKLEEIKKDVLVDLFTTNEEVSKNPVEENVPKNFSNTPQSSIPENEGEIERIVIFYRNGTFKTYSPQ